MEKLKNYEGMRVAEKIKIINNILTAMFEDQGKSENTYDVECYLDILTNWTGLQKLTNLSKKMQTVFHPSEVKYFV